MRTVGTMHENRRCKLLSTSVLMISNNMRTVGTSGPILFYSYLLILSYSLFNNI
jgi:hypothetical protein